MSDQQKKQSRRRMKFAAHASESDQGAKEQEAGAPASSSTQRTFTGVPPADRLGLSSSQRIPTEYIQARGDDPELRNPTQSWVVMSYVGPQGTRVKSREVMVKYSQAFPTTEAADDYATKVRNQSHHTLVDTAVVCSGEWLTVPMPDSVKATVQKHYVNQPVLDKLMEGQWKSAEEGRRNVAKREAAARERNRRRLKALYGEDYEQPTRNEEVHQQEEERMAQSKPEDEEAEKKKSLSIADVVVSYAKFLLAEKKRAAAASEVAGEAAAAADKPFSPSDLDEELKSRVRAFREFITADTIKMEELVQKTAKLLAETPAPTSQPATAQQQPDQTAPPRP